MALLPSISKLCPLKVKSLVITAMRPPKLVILAGGLGTRLSEETTLRPKPLVEIGGRPIIWHIMKFYASYGIREFIVCCGYKGEMIKSYFANYFLMTSDIVVDLADHSIEYLTRADVDWKITLVDTGLHTLTGGRIKRIADHISSDTFCLTYGDGLSDVNIKQLIAFHQDHGRAATVTAVPSPGRFGILDLSADHKVTRFHEKPDNEMGWINGGFFVLNRKVFDYIQGDQTTWEREPLERLAADGELNAFQHNGFWKPMDTLRDKTYLEEIWADGSAPWRIWT